MKKTVHQHFNTAFGDVGAYLISESNGTICGTVCVKYPKDGAGRVWVYLTIPGGHRVRASADGYGYDKVSAAFRRAVEELRVTYPFAPGLDLAKIESHSWDRAMTDADHVVLRVL